MMECDRIIIYACRSPYQVSSFRSAKLPELHESLKQSLEEAAKEGISAANQKKFSIPGFKGTLPYGKRRSTQVDIRKKSQQPTTGLIAPPAAAGTGGQVGGKVAKALEKAEHRRIKRQLRQAEVRSYNVLYCAVYSAIIFCCNIVHCTALRCAALRCAALRYTALYCTVIW
jgi:hypothetical protein